MVFADADDSTTGCEVAPDRDGDGTVNEADCQPDNAAVHPGAGEIFGNAVDEDCANGPGYFKVTSSSKVDFKTRKRAPRVRITRVRLTGLQPGDRIELRCSGRRKGCPFKLVRRTAGRPTMNLVSVFKKRFLRRGAVLEIRILRANYVGKVQRVTVDPEEHQADAAVPGRRRHPAGRLPGRGLAPPRRAADPGAAGRGCVVAGERGELDELLAGHEPRAGEPGSRRGRRGRARCRRGR